MSSKKCWWSPLDDHKSSAKGRTFLFSGRSDKLAYRNLKENKKGDAKRSRIYDSLQGKIGSLKIIPSGPRINAEGHYRRLFDFP